MEDSEKAPRYWKIVGISLLVSAGVFLLYLFLTRANAILVGLALTLAAAIGTGLILERIDRSRHLDAERTPEDYWGFRGRPGS